MTQVPFTLRPHAAHSGLLRLLHGLVVLALAAALVAGCAGQDDASLSEGRCSTAEECPVDFACSPGGACVPAPGAPCSEQEPCPDGYFCNEANACQAERPGESTLFCDAAIQCQDTQICLGGQCRRLECTGESDCPADARCVGTICRAAPSCEDDGPCGPLGFCLDGRCLPGCTGNAECGFSSLTRCVGNRCVPTCDDDATCAPGERCREGACLPDECRGFGVEDCPENQRCDGDGMCVDIVTCETAEQCAEDERCEDGVCESRARCRADIDCSARDGQYCLQEACVMARACRVAEPACLGGEVCIEDLCIPSGCVGDGECRSSELCDLGRCRAREQVPVAGLHLAPLDVLSPSRNVPTRILVIPLDADGVPLPGPVSATSVTVEPAAALRTVGSASSDDLAIYAGDDPQSARIIVRLVSNPEIQASLEINARRARSPETRSVLVHDSETLSPIADAIVVLEGRTRVSESDGIAGFPEQGTSPDPPVTEPEGENGDDDEAHSFIHGRAPGHVHALLLDPGTATANVPLRPSRSPDRVVEGTFSVQGDPRTLDGMGALAVSSQRPDLAHITPARLLGRPTPIENPLAELGYPAVALPEGVVLRVDFLSIGFLRERFLTSSRHRQGLIVHHGGAFRAEDLLSSLRPDQIPPPLAFIHELLPRFTRTQPVAGWQPTGQNGEVTLEARATVLTRRLVRLPEASPDEDERLFAVTVHEHPLYGWVPIGIDAIEPDGTLWLNAAAAPARFRGRHARVIVLRAREARGDTLALPHSVVGMTRRLAPGQRTVDLSAQPWPSPIDAAALDPDEHRLTLPEEPWGAWRFTVETSRGELDVWIGPGARGTLDLPAVGPLLDDDGHALPILSWRVTAWELPEGAWEDHVTGLRGGLARIGDSATRFAHARFEAGSDEPR